MAVNKWHGIGNLGKDPEMRVMPDGKSVANISIAITEKYKDKNGEQKEVTEWVNIAFFGKLAEIVGQYLHKGSQVYVEGKLRTEKYQKDGQDRYVTRIIGESMQMVGGKSDSKPRESVKPSSPPMNGGLDDIDEDIPF